MENGNFALLRDWFMTCPLLSPDSHFRMDYLGDAAVEYSIVAIPTNIATHENVLGEMVPNDIQELNFIFAGKQIWGADEAQNLANLYFYQEIISWVIEQNAAQHFPQIMEGRVTSIVPTLTPHIAQTDADHARYEIQLKLKYHMY